MDRPDWHATTILSVRRGDAVVVHGRVRVDVWEREGQPSSVSWIVDATFVGHDLTRGTSAFVKTARAVRDPREDEAVRLLRRRGGDVEEAVGR